MEHVFDFNDKNVDATAKFICGTLRVKQPQELMNHPPEEPSDNSQSEDIDPAAKFGPRVTARQLSRALKNLKTQIIKERGSVPPTDQEAVEPLRDVIQPRVNIGTSMTTTSAPIQSSNTNVHQTVSCIIWVHLQASICTEWEQNSMVLTPGTNIGARVTSNPFKIGTGEQEPGSTSQASQIMPAASKSPAIPPIPSGAPSQKKPKTIHRCILQRASKSRSQEASLTCHVCKASYENYDSYFTHLIDTTCVKNKAARVTSPTTPTADSRIESKLLQSLHKSRCREKVASISEDDEEIHIEAEFITANKKTVKHLTTNDVQSTSSTAITTSTSSSSKSICSPVVTPTTDTAVPKPVTATKRGRPFKLNLAAIVPRESIPPPAATAPPIATAVPKRPYSRIASPDILVGPLNLSKRPAIDPGTPTELDLPPLLPISHSHHYMEHKGRELLGSTGSGGGASSTETSPNVTDVYLDKGDFGNVLVDRMRLYEDRNENTSKARNAYVDEGHLSMSLQRLQSVSNFNFLVSPKICLSSPSFISEKRGTDGLSFLSEANKVQHKHQYQQQLLHQHQEQQNHLLQLLNQHQSRHNEVHKPFPDPRKPEVSESNFCPHWAATTLPALSLTEHSNDQSKLAILKNQVTKLLVTTFGEDQLSGQMNYPETDILTILINVIETTTHQRALQIGDCCTEICQTLTPSLAQNQLRFRHLRREIFVARSNVAKFLRSQYPDKWDVYDWSKIPVELILSQIIHV